MQKILKISFSIVSIFSLLFWPTKSLFAAQITGLTLTPGQLSLEAGKTANFTLTAAYNDGTTADVTEQSLFTLNGGGFTGIPGQKGLFTAEAQGEWLMTANFNGFNATTKISITHSSPTKLNVLPTSANLTADGILPIRVFAVDSLGNGWDVAKDATLSTTDPAGTVTTDGYIPHTAGTWTVTAVYQGLTGSFPVTITPGMLTSLTITPAEKLTVDEGDKVSFVAKGTDSKGNQVTTNVTWKVTNEKIAKISDTGELKTSEAGQTNIVAQAGEVETIIPIVINAAEATGTNSSSEVVQVSKPSSNLNPRVAADETEKVPVQEENTQSTNTSTNNECKNIAHPWTIILILLQVILLAAYFTWQLRKPMKLWWIAPVILTAGLLIIYSQLFCNNTYLWWPWLVLGISIVFISVYYQRLGLHDAAPPGNDNQN